jgi:tetratricopeptide (TPR) repeat protein
VYSLAQQDTAVRLRPASGVYVWLNGKRIGEPDAWLSSAADEEVLLVPLRKGWNSLAVRGIDKPPAGGYYLRWSEALRDRARAYARAGRWEKAIEAITAAQQPGRRKDPPGGLDLFLLALAHARLDHKEEARRWYDRAVAWLKQNDPDEGTHRLALRVVAEVGRVSAAQANRLLEEIARQRWLDRLGRAVKLQPRDPGPLLARAAVYLQAQRWSEAAADRTRCLALLPAAHVLWYQTAPLLLWAGNVEGYRRHRREMLARFGNTQDPVIAERTAKVCLLQHGGTEELRLSAQLAELAVRTGQGRAELPYFELALALADYRRGQFAAAEERLGKLLASGKGEWNLAGPGYLVLAMTRQRQGQEARAREALGAANQVLQKRMPRWADAGAGWHDWLICQLLRREAEALIAGGRGAPH